jgi:WD40 repeat protein
VLTITDDGQLHRWTGGEKKQPALVLSQGLVGATLDADRRRAVGWSIDHVVGLWSTESGQALTLPMRHDKSPLGIQGAASSPDGSRILSWGDDRTARVWDSASGKLLALLRHPGAVSGAEQSADNSRVLTWGDDRVVRLWDAESQKMLLALPAHDYGVQGATLTQNKARILTWDTNGVLRFWGAGDGAAINQFSHSTGVPIRGAVFSRDERRLLVWDQESVAIWSVDGGGIPSAVRWSADDLQKAGFNADESVVVTQGGDGAVRFWESRYGYPLTLPFVLNGPVQGAGLSQDEKSFLAWTLSLVKVWNVAVEYGQSGAVSAPTLEARTGTRLDRLGELEIIPTDVWKKMQRGFVPVQPGK